jgi:hypothetical protein
MENPSKIETLFSKAGDYLETRVELFSLKTIDKTAEVVSSVVMQAVLLMIMTFFLLLLSVGAAFWAGDLLGKTYYGFFAVAGFYLITGLIIYAGRKKWVKTPVSNLIIKKTLK